jgi:hypothetical protein
MACKKISGDYLLQKSITEGTPLTVFGYPDGVGEYTPSVLRVPLIIPCLSLSRRRESSNFDWFLISAPLRNDILEEPLNIDMKG